MGFTKKTWKNRIAEYINRRLITMEDGSTNLVTVARDEGTISQEGDAFNAANMNDLEDRIESEFNEINQSLTKIGECVILGQTSSTSESNKIELPDNINNYKLLILMYVSPGDAILNTNIFPVEYFKQTKYRVVAIWTNTSFGAFAKYIDDTHINLYVRTQYSAVLIGVKNY